MDLKRKIEEKLIEIKEQQQNRLFIRNLNELKKLFKDRYEILKEVLELGVDYDDFFSELSRYFRGHYTFVHEDYENDEIIKKFDPLDGTWLKTSNFIGPFENDENFKSINPLTRWGRFIYYLKNFKGFSIETTKKIADSSLEVIARCHNPQSPSEQFSKGMVVGSVQSGKTTNFNAVINSAYDVGFNMIIVLTGITEDLRSQTQQRLNVDLGNCEKNVGVNQVIGNSGLNVQNISSLTTVNEDFNAAAVDAGINVGNQPTLIVSKKNKDTLFNIFRFLRDKVEESAIDNANFNLLLVDDEADNATINGIGHRNIHSDATVINGLIRGILNIFKKKTYIAYTATPFANILQDANLEGIWNYVNQGKEYQIPLSSNLFPENFVRLLDPPPNYIGPRYFFDTDPQIQENFDFLIKTISDTEEFFPERIDNKSELPIKFVKNENEFNTNEDLIQQYENFSTYKKETRAPKPVDNKHITALPHSLKDAIYCFIITIAVRKIRAEKFPELNSMQRHNSMLIHISRFSSWQNKLKKLIENENQTGFLDEIFWKLNTHNKGEGVYLDFERVWNYYYSDIIGNLNGIMENHYYDPYIQKVELENVFKVLPSIARDGIKVLSINTTNINDILDYNSKSGKNYIAIGGNRLSRGFTLEGLSISYFTRTTGYADAILQMGRWFGYRPGYLDCCRLFTDVDSYNKFSECVKIIDELEKDIMQHMADPLSVSKKIVNRIKSISGHFINITRPNILRNAELAYYSFSDTLVQTYRFNLEKTDHANSWVNFKSFFEKHTQKMISDIDGNIKLTVTDFEVVKNLINTSLILNKGFDKERLFDFIDLQRNKNEFLKTWDILFINGPKNSKKNSQINLGPFSLNTVVRSGPNEGKLYNQLLTDGYYSVKKAMIISPTDMGLGLVPEEQNKIKLKFSDYKTIPEYAYRRAYGKYKGIVLVYLIDTEHVLTDNLLKQKLDLDLNIPIASFAIGIPDLEIEPEVFYLMEREILDADFINENTEEEEEV